MSLKLSLSFIATIILCFDLYFTSYHKLIQTQYQQIKIYANYNSEKDIDIQNPRTTVNGASRLVEWYYFISYLFIFILIVSIASMIIVSLYSINDKSFHNDSND